MLTDCASNTLVFQPASPGPSSPPDAGGNVNSPSSEAASPPQVGKTTSTKKAKAKVPRPPNAFIIYRKEWHPKIVAKMPNLHNNQISVIIGQQWRNESDSIKDAYKRKAESAKSQHALDHPDYQYQPRKPSEKKKRMTKRKLTATNAAQKVPVAPSAPSVGFTVNDYVEPYLPQNFCLDSDVNKGTFFDIGQDARSGLIDSVAQHKEQHTGAATKNAPVAWTTGIDLVSGREQHERMVFDSDIEDLFAFEAEYLGSRSQESAPDATGPSAMAEVYRQNRLEAELGVFGQEIFDFDSASAGPTLGEQHAQVAAPDATSDKVGVANAEHVVDASE